MRSTLLRIIAIAGHVQIARLLFCRLMHVHIAQRHPFHVTLTDTRPNATRAGDFLIPQQMFRPAHGVIIYAMQSA